MLTRRPPGNLARFTRLQTLILDKNGLPGLAGFPKMTTITTFWFNNNDMTDLVEFMDEVKKLVSLRKNHDALIHGGLRWVSVEDDYFVFLRESKKESILVLISRTGINATIDINSLGYSVAKTLYGQEARGKSISIKSKFATQGVWLLKS